MSKLYSFVTDPDVLMKTGLVILGADLLYLYIRRDALNRTIRSIYVDLRSRYVDYRLQHDPNVINYYPYNIIINCGDNDGMPVDNTSCLTYLVMNTRNHPEYLDQIRYILDNYPDEINRISNNGWGPINTTLTRCHTTSTLDTLRLLLEYNPDMNNVFLCYAIDSSCFYEIVKLLVDKYQNDFIKIINRLSCFMHLCHDKDIK